jgi:hypothetical protein
METGTIDVPAQDSTTQPAGSQARRSVLLSAAALIALAAVGSAAFLAGTSVGTAPEAAPPAADAPAAAQPAQKTDWDQVVAFDKAMGGDDPAAMQPMVSPGSPAERWLAYWSIVVATDTAAGVTDQGDPGTAVYDEKAGTVATTYKDGSTTVTKDWVTDTEGRIVSWSNEAGVPIADRLWTQTSTGSGAGQTVTVTSAYLSSSGTLIITADITGSAGSQVDYRPTYIGADGVAREPAYMTGPDEVTPGGTAKVAYGYEGAEFGGKFVYDAWNISTSANGKINLTVQ